MPAVELSRLVAPALPPRKGARGYFAMAVGRNVIHNSLRDIIGTEPGERPMRPEYGCLIHSLPFEPADDVTLRLFEQHVLDAIARLERRVLVRAVTADFDQTDPRGVVLFGSVLWVFRTALTRDLEQTDFRQRL